MIFIFSSAEQSKLVLQLDILLEINLSVVLYISVVLQVPQDSLTLRKNIYYCSSCSQYLPSTEFQLSSNSKAVGRCRQCCKKTNEAITRQEQTQYSYILQSVCCTEQMFGDNSKIAFLMQVFMTWFSSVITDVC